ncbi:nuclear transport factor 2 family protein [Pontibacter korlensis]|uniref:DUF4440 domain-containing protein n=1 Tax=Pontibacter korlensis TaxID=400092 RepID=A0A0E3ZID3_9BACT|nr:nuclear transport factor 2 family protein [Pontibacter korlensis]AKD05324.1 hypothetical protein PKOR_22530 [Pontibacter korlensis]
MKNLVSLFLLGFIGLSIFSCNEKEVDIEQEKKNLMQASREWAASAKSKNLEKTLDYWADDAVIISAGEPELRGKEAIRGMVQGSFQDPSFEINWEPERAEISKSGDMGYLLENSTVSFKDSTGKVMSQQLRSVTIWKKQDDGTWKNVVDIMSPKAPK